MSNITIIFVVLQVQLTQYAREPDIEMTQYLGDIEQSFPLWIALQIRLILLYIK